MFTKDNIGRALAAREAGGKVWSKYASAMAEVYDIDKAAVEAKLAEAVKALAAAAEAEAKAAAEAAAAKAAAAAAAERKAAAERFAATLKGITVPASVAKAAAEADKYGAYLVVNVGAGGAAVLDWRFRVTSTGGGGKGGRPKADKLTGKGRMSAWAAIQADKALAPLWTREQTGSKAGRGGTVPVYQYRYKGNIVKGSIASFLANMLPESEAARSLARFDDAAKAAKATGAQEAEAKAEAKAEAADEAADEADEDEAADE